MGAWLLRLLPLLALLAATATRARAADATDASAPPRFITHPLVLHALPPGAAHVSRVTGGGHRAELTFELAAGAGARFRLDLRLRESALSPGFGVTELLPGGGSRRLSAAALGIEHCYYEGVARAVHRGGAAVGEALVDTCSGALRGFFSDGAELFLVGPADPRDGGDAVSTLREADGRVELSQPHEVLRRAELEAWEAARGVSPPLCGLIAGDAAADADLESRPTMHSLSLRPLAAAAAAASAASASSGAAGAFELSAAPARAIELVMLVDTRAQSRYFGGSATTAANFAAALANHVDRYYQLMGAEFGFGVRLNALVVWGTDQIPVQDSMDPATLLQSLVTYGNANNAGALAHDAIALLTGSSFANNVVGLARLSAPCTGSQLSTSMQSVNNVLLDGGGAGSIGSLVRSANVLAHEIGHNMDFRHSNEVAQGDPTCDGNWIMQAVAGSNYLWDRCTREHAAAVLAANGYACLGPARSAAVVQCHSGQYSTRSDTGDASRCADCHASCYECVGAGPNRCSLCPEPLVKFGGAVGQCVAVCPPGFFRRDTENRPRPTARDGALCVTCTSPPGVNCSANGTVLVCDPTTGAQPQCVAAASLPATCVNPLLLDCADDEVLVCEPDASNPRCERLESSLSVPALAAGVALSAALLGYFAIAFLLQRARGGGGGGGGGGGAAAPKPAAKPAPAAHPAAAAPRRKSLAGGEATLEVEPGTPAPAPEAPLPTGWEAHTDGATGVRYYFNVSTGASQWERPAAL